jgi:DNA polymerase (family 10)
MKNQQIAKIFNELAQLLELKGESIFRIRAYRRAAQNIADFSKDVAMCTEEELMQLPGIGKDLAGKIKEYCETGKVAKHDEMIKDIPSGVLDMSRIPGVGPKTAKMLYEQVKIRSIDELEAMARAGRLAGLRGIQKKTEENIIKGIEQMSRGTGRHLLGRVLPLADDIVRRMKEGAPVDKITVAGSIRRWKETVKDVDILTTSRNPEKVMEVFVTMPHVVRVLAKGVTKSSVILDGGIQADLRVVEEDSFGAALQYFTGSKQHNIRLREMAVKAGLKINEYGVFKLPGDRKIGGQKEEEVYRALNLPYIPPELREDTGEIDAALAGTLPDLITLQDIKGDLHVHTKWSDGRHDLDTIISAAREKGYQYIAITDHTKGLGVAHGLDESRFAEQAQLIDDANRRLTGFRVLKGAEVDIRSEGTLDIGEQCLSGLDIVVASIHSGFKQPEEQITRRILSAIRNPFVSVIAHPTGRLIGERDAYAVDMEAVLKEAAQHGVAVEVNAYPQRLDLSDGFLRMAKQYGVPIMINTDTHITNHLDYMNYGVSIARRGWIEEKDVLNALPYEQLIERLKAMRARRQKNFVSERTKVKGSLPAKTQRRKEKQG